MLGIGPRWEYLDLERPEPLVHDVPIEWPAAAPSTWVCPLTRYGDGEVRLARRAERANSERRRHS